MRFTRSLKFYFFANVLLAALVVLYANRLISQWLLQAVVEKEQVAQIALTLRQCKNDRHSEKDLRSCIQKTNQRLVDSFVADAYVLCTSGFSTTPRQEHSLCAGPINLDSKYPIQDHVRSGSLLHDGERWIAAEFNQGNDRLMIAAPVSRLQNAIADMWSTRDKLLAYSALPLILSLALLAIFIAYLATRPIKAISRALEKLHPESLDQPVDVKSPFKEFDGFVDLYKHQHQTIQDHLHKSRRFISHASHELRSPLTVLRGNTELLMGDLKTGSPEQEKLASISEEVEELIEIINKLLLLQKADDKKLTTVMRSINFSAMISEYLADIESFNSTISLVKQIQPDLFLSCEPLLVKQLIANLIGNAIKYNLPEGWVNVQLTVENQEICLQISNPTVGDSSQFTGRIFERFYRGQNSRLLDADGHGLGLSICQEIAMAHSASLSVTFENGVITFRCCFPGETLP